MAALPFSADLKNLGVFASWRERRLGKPSVAGAVGDDGVVGDWRIRPTTDRALFRIKHSDRESLQLLER